MGLASTIRYRNRITTEVKYSTAKDAKKNAKNTKKLKQRESDIKKGFGALHLRVLLHVVFTTKMTVLCTFELLKTFEFRCRAPSSL